MKDFNLTLHFKTVPPPLKEEKGLGYDSPKSKLNPRKLPKQAVIVRVKTKQGKVIYDFGCYNPWERAWDYGVEDAIYDDDKFDKVTHYAEIPKK